MEIVAFCGTGKLGSAMVEGMLRRGVRVRVWNRSESKARDLEKHGAEVFSDAAEAASGARRVHLCLHDDASVDSVLEAIRPGLTVDKPIVDHTTLSPQRVAERVARLRESGYSLLHAPVFMGPPAARNSTGVMMTSGDPALFARLREPLEAMCGDLRYLGERPDLAAIYKLMGNAMLLAVVGGLNDMLRLAEEEGLARTQAYGLFEFFNPCTQIEGRGKRMAEGEYDPSWSVDIAHKDALLMQAAAHHERLPVIDAIEGLLRNVSDRGLGDRDLAAVAQR